MIAANSLRDQSLDLLLRRQPEAAQQTIKQCIELHPQQSHHFVSKALVELTIGNAKIAETDLNRAITLDYLNHHAYFNLFVLQMREGETASAFKNLCCCLSVAHLLRAEREESLEAVERAIDYCFNNKQARMLKCILKMQAGKSIDALNQINYALYLAPSHQTLKTVQEKVYRAMGMKQLKGKNTPFQKQKYDRLETNMEVPSSDKINNQINKLLKQYNTLLKGLDNTDVYKVILMPKQTENKMENEKMPQKDVKKAALKFYLAGSQNNVQQTVIGAEWAKDKYQKESTANNSEHIAKQESFKPNPEQYQRTEPFFVLDSSSFSNLSISNISQNSNIKMNKIRANLIDFSDNSRSLTKEEQASLNQNMLESSVTSNTSKGQLKLPLRLSELKNNEKILVTLQRTVMNDHGQMEKIEQLYEVVEGSSKLELVKVNK